MFNFPKKGNCPFSPGMDIEVKIQHGIGTYDNYGN